MSSSNSEFNVLDYGAKSNSALLQTEAFQKAIDACRDSGGGEIIVPKGIYYIGSIRLYSNMTLRLQKDVILRGSRNPADYIDFETPSTLRYLYDDHYKKIWNLPKYYVYSLISAYNEQNISIIGEKGSVIDGQNCFDPDGEEKFRGPMGISLSCCMNVRLEGYTFINSSNWSHQLDSCQNIVLDGINIYGGHDGFNLHHCKQILAQKCDIQTGDDCFAGYDIEELKVFDCKLNTACNVMRIGGAHIEFNNCQIYGPGKYPHLSHITYETHRFFKYYAIRPDDIRNEGYDIVIKNSVIKDIPELIQYEYGKEQLMQNNLPLRDIVFENVKIEGLSKKSVIKGNGQSCSIKFLNCEIDLQDNLTSSNFLDIDLSVKVEFENTQFN